MLLTANKKYKMKKILIMSKFSFVDSLSEVIASVRLSHLTIYFIMRRSFIRCFNVNQSFHQCISHTTTAAAPSQAKATQLSVFER